MSTAVTGLPQIFIDKLVHLFAWGGKLKYKHCSVYYTAVLLVYLMLYKYKT